MRYLIDEADCREIDRLISLSGEKDNPIPDDAVSDFVERSADFAFDVIAERVNGRIVLVFRSALSQMKAQARMHKVIQDLKEDLRKFVYDPSPATL